MSKQSINNMLVMEVNIAFEINTEEKRPTAILFQILQK